ncbi:BnaA06g16680D [Brassica napus]|uniref:BnaA06g16680D protein n=1 Tax=Brassica napus TaxID=3708 RepID=A0A078IBA9_BRANA|nr:BnaA06g16680D [Brassica napus]
MIRNGSLFRSLAALKTGRCNTTFEVQCNTNVEKDINRTGIKDEDHAIKSPGDAEDSDDSTVVATSLSIGLNLVADDSQNSGAEKRKVAKNSKTEALYKDHLVSSSASKHRIGGGSSSSLAANPYDHSTSFAI